MTRGFIVPKGFFREVNSFKNKEGTSLVPAPAVIPTFQVVVRIIGFKMFVVDLKSL